MNFTRHRNRAFFSARSLASLGALALAIGCSSGGDNNSGTGGATGSGGHGTGGAATGTGGSSSGTGGAATGTGGAATGTGGAATGTGGAMGTGGATTDAGTDGGPRGTGGATTDAGTDSGPRGTGGSTDAGRTDGGGATLTLTSTAFTEGGRFPAANTCTGGAHQSPALTWTAGPSATMSYAIVLTDTTNGFHHWVIWDIPATPTSLPAMLAKTATLTSPAGAREVNRFGSNGYFGPCPSGTDHIYQFEVTALDVAMLSVAGTVATTAAGVDTVLAQIQMHALAHGDLSGVSNASM